MLDPIYLMHVSEGAEEIAAKLHDYLLSEIVRRMVIRISRRDDYLLTSADAWRVKTLQDAGYLAADIEREIAALTGLQQDEISRAMMEAGIKSLEYSKMVYEAAGLSSRPLAQSPDLMRLMERNYAVTRGLWINYTRSMADSAQQAYIRACDTAYNLATTGTESASKAISDAVDRAVEDGVRIAYPSGHTDTIEAATARAVRTGITQAAAEITMARMDEMHWDIVLVSAHVGARTGDGSPGPENHAWWQGRYYSRSGRDKRFRPLSDTGYGTGEGLCGWNCRHSFGPGTGAPEDNPYTEIDREENKRIEDLEKRQRYLERRVRKSIREAQAEKAAAEAAKDVEVRKALMEKSIAISQKLTRQRKEYKAFCEANHLRPQIDRMKIARNKRPE